MTVDAQTPRKSYTYSGTGTPYPVTFTFLGGSDLGVIHTDSGGVNTTLTLNTQYTVSGGEGSTGTVTVTDAALDTGTGSKLTIFSDLDIEQSTDLVNGAAFLAESLEDQFDRNVRVMQQMQEAIGRAVKVGVASGTDPDALLEAIDTTAAAAAASAASAETTAAAAAASAASAETTAAAAAASAASAETAKDEAVGMLEDALMVEDIGVTVEAHDPDILRADTADLLQALYGDEPQVIHTAISNTNTLTITRNHLEWSLSTTSALGPLTVWPYEGTYVFHIYPNGNDVVLHEDYKRPYADDEPDPNAGEVRIVVEVFNDRKTIVAIQNIGA